MQQVPAVAMAVAGEMLSGRSMGAGQQLKALELAAERLDAHVLQPDSQNVTEFSSLCVSLSRDIDCAVANKEVLPKVQDLPSLLQKICRCKNDNLLQAAIMVLMFSVKSACENGWFTFEEAQELLALADEIGSGFLSRSINGSLVSTISTIMARFYPLLKMGQILASLEVEPGYGAFMTSFHISKNLRYSAHEKIRLFVAQTDETETSACIISPQQVKTLDHSCRQMCLQCSNMEQIFFNQWVSSMVWLKTGFVCLYIPVSL